MESEERVENRRFLRRLQQENKEREMAAALKSVSQCFIFNDFYLISDVSEEPSFKVNKMLNQIVF